MNNKVQHRLSLVPSHNEAMAKENGEDLFTGTLLPPDSRCIHELFEQQVINTPGALAVICEGHSLTFEELNKKTNFLAAHLRQMGVGAETIVGICAQDSIELLIGIMGILKAGGAYVPIDPQYPQERQAYLLQDSGTHILLTQRQFIPNLPASDAKLVLLNDMWDESLLSTPIAVDIPPPNVVSDSPACIIYTSGSTGRPKGVVITHRGLVNLVHAGADEFMLRPGDRFLQVASISFSAALEELFPALLSGACVVFFPNRQALTSIPVLLELLEREQITVFELTTALWHELVEELTNANKRLPASVRLVVMGGERALPALVARWRSFGVPLVHVYGPTESTATATYYALDVHREAKIESQRLPIGYPILNTRIYLLDHNLQLVPDNEPGELYIGGVALARGYWKRPGQTAEKFVPDPFSLEAGTRLYRTGDIARYLSDGSLEFLGRADHQVKVRGFRIEPAEIELALESHTMVGHALVITREEQPGETQLLAYVVPAEAQSLIVGDLRAYLRHMLPEYMVPTAFVVLDAFPLTSHGKVDRSALPAPDPKHLQRAHAYVEPCTEVEVSIAAVWAEVLGLERVGMRDNFFELGGHSLLAARISSRLRVIFAVPLLPNHVLEAPSVAVLAERIKALREESYDSTPAHNLEPADLARLVQRRSLIMKALSRKAGMPVTGLASATQQGMWFLDRLVPGSTLYSVPFTYQLVGRLDVPALQAALEDIVTRHETLRSRYVAVDGRPVQVVESIMHVELLIENVSNLPVDQRTTAIERLTTQEAYRPFDLERGPLLRVRLLQLEEEQYLLVVNVHHLIFDGWSLGILLHELRTLYLEQVRARHKEFAESSLVNGLPNLPALSVSYADYALWQREQADKLEVDLLYWREQLTGAPTVLNLPTDRSRPSTQSFRGAVLTRHLGGEPLNQALDGLAREERVTRFMVLLATWTILLQRYSGQQDLVVGTPLAGRTRRELEGLIGFFVTTLPLRIHVTENLSFRQLLDEVRTVALGAYGHQEVPLDRIVEAVAPVAMGRSLGHNPLFQVAFAADEEEVGQQVQKWGDGLVAGPLHELETGTSKFDLTWTVTGLGTAQTMGVNVEYSTDLFEKERIERMVEHFGSLLEAALAAPDARLADLPVTIEYKDQLVNAGYAPVTEEGIPTKRLEHESSDLTDVPSEEISEVESILCTLWAEAFGTGDVGREEDFFEIGGYSLLAIQLVTRISDHFKIAVSLQEFFEAATIAELATIIVAATKGDDEHKWVEISRVERDEQSLDELLAEIERLSESEVQVALLKAVPATTQSR